MSIFGDIMSKIFGTSVPGTVQGSMTGGPSAAGAGTAAGSAPSTAAAAAPSAGQKGATPASSVDVAKILDALEEDSDEDLDWRKSIVDLMKLLDMDSGLGPRRELAKELGYTADTKDTAAMNVWLHKQVMTKLAATGGKVPAELKH